VKTAATIAAMLKPAVPTMILSNSWFLTALSVDGRAFTLRITVRVVCG
jgi:hypothetical protein